MTGPPLGPASASEILDIKREKEGREKHPELYPVNRSPALAGSAEECCCCCCYYCGLCPREEALVAVAAASATATAAAMQQKRCYCEATLEGACVLGDPKATAAQCRQRFDFIEPIYTIDGEVSTRTPKASASPGLLGATTE